MQEVRIEGVLIREAAVETLGARKRVLGGGHQWLVRGSAWSRDGV